MAQSNLDIVVKVTDMASRELESIGSLVDNVLSPTGVFGRSGQNSIPIESNSTTQLGGEWEDFIKALSDVVGQIENLLNLTGKAEDRIDAALSVGIMSRFNDVNLAGVKDSKWEHFSPSATNMDNAAAYAMYTSVADTESELIDLFDVSSFISMVSGQDPEKTPSRLIEAISSFDWDEISLLSPNLNQDEVIGDIAGKSLAVSKEFLLEALTSQMNIDRAEIVQDDPEYASFLNYEPPPSIRWIVPPKNFSSNDGESFRRLVPPINFSSGDSEEGEGASDSFINLPGLVNFSSGDSEEGDPFTIIPQLDSSEFEAGIASLQGMWDSLIESINQIDTSAAAEALASTVGAVTASMEANVVGIVGGLNSLDGKEIDVDIFIHILGGDFRHGLRRLSDCWKPIYCRRARI